MSEGNSVVNLGDISKPATVLIEKISNAVGILYEPRKIKKLAKANAEADKIKLLAQLELSDIEQRAMQRVITQEAKKQQNIESITAQAIQELPDDSNTEALEEDWVAHFFSKCENVSDSEMQSLWSKLLSNEANKPGTFSKRTVDFVASMDKKDAKMFTDLCQFVWFHGNCIPLIFDVNADVYNEVGVNFSNLKHLDAIGLISFEPTAGYVRRKLRQDERFHYYGKPTDLYLKQQQDNQINLGTALLTQTGHELVNVCGSKPNDAFYDYVIRQWFEAGILTSSPIT
ncbi:DUF2806 domain-containing protein [Vibrio crassostreae]|uniref:DUF2806 domain-containing protein n=1 Tax=Vibrio crassostreae TaxID=246167 RepID=UPI001BD3E48C|nr:DUF2806 domain-containing protein [Vibrio crassostreae]